MRSTEDLFPTEELLCGGMIGAMICTPEKLPGGMIGFAEVALSTLVAIAGLALRVENAVSII